MNRSEGNFYTLLLDANRVRRVALSGALRVFGDVYALGSVARALRVLRTRPGCASVVVAPSVPDGAVTEVVEAVRAQHPHALAIVLEDPGWDIVAEESFAYVFRRPHTLPRLRRLIEPFWDLLSDASNVVSGTLRSARKLRYLSALVREARLTQRERQVVDAYLECPDRRLASSRLGLSPRTYDTHVRHILWKTTHRSMQDLFREATESIDSALSDSVTPDGSTRRARQAAGQVGGI